MGKNTPVFSSGISLGCYEDSMRHALASLVLALFLFPSIAFGETMDDLVKRDGIYYKKDTDVPFTGKITGRKQGSFKDGKMEGPWVYYRKNGQLFSKGTYKDGKKDGPYVDYYAIGQLASKGTYKDGNKHGPWILYYENGQLWDKNTYKDGEVDGPWVSYHENGQLREKGTYKVGKRNGPWVFYRENGDEDLTGASSTKYYDHEGSGTYKDGKKISN